MVEEIVCLESKTPTNKIDTQNKRKTVLNGNLKNSFFLKVPKQDRNAIVRAIVNSRLVCNGPNANLLLNRVSPIKNKYKHFSLSLMIYIDNKKSMKEMIYNMLWNFMILFNIQTISCTLAKHFVWPSFQNLYKICNYPTCRE